MGNKLTNLVLTANKLKLESERESITRLERKWKAVFCKTIEKCSPCAHILPHTVFPLTDIDPTLSYPWGARTQTFPLLFFMSSYIR